MRSPPDARRVEEGDILDVVEAAYRVDEPERDWLGAIAKAADPLLDQSFGTIAFVADVSTRFEVIHVVGTNSRFQPSESMRLANTAPIEAIQGIFRAAPGQTISQFLTSAGRRDLLAYVKHDGVEDMFGATAIDPSMIVVGICAPLPSEQRVSRAVQAAWSRVAVHLSAGLRLRRRLERKGEKPSDELMRRSEAILTPGGRVEHAEGIAREGVSRAALRDAARAIDRARGSMRRRDPSAALDLWQGLVSGRWSLVDHFDSDGRRFVVARENEPGGPRLAPLSPRERAVLSLRAQGRSTKMIAYELGLGVSAVGALLWRARRKLGIGADADLSALLVTGKDKAQ